MWVQPLQNCPAMGLLLEEASGHGGGGGAPEVQQQEGRCRMGQQVPARGQTPT